MRTLHSLRLEVRRKVRSQDVLFIFNALETLRVEEFGTLLEDEVEANLVPDQVILVVREPMFAQTFELLSQDPQVTTALARLGGRSVVTLIGYNLKGEEASRRTLGGNTPALKVELKDIRRRALAAIFSHRHGFVESTSTYHFENPSGRHSDRFIRVSNILTQGAEITFIAFCALPMIPDDVRQAYIDTPALFTVVAAINEQWRSFDREGLLVDNFSSYAGAKGAEFDTERSFVLISASSSGSLANELTGLRGFPARQVVHLLFLGDNAAQHTVVGDLQLDALLNPDGVTRTTVSTANDCVPCRNGSHAIKLQGDQFEFAGPQHDSLLIKSDDRPPGLDGLMARLAGTGVFAVGLGASGKPPRQFEVSATQLMAAVPFLERLDYAARRSIPARTGHIIAADPQSETLAHHIRATAAPQAKVVAREAIDAEVDKTSDTAIVIVATVIESGRTLLDLSRDLRSIAPDAPLTYLVGLSKGTGDPGRSSLAASLRKTHNPYPYEFLAIEEIVLPASSSHNAWAAEAQLLQRASASRVPAPVAALVKARLDRLRRASEALADDLFLGNGSDRSLKLQPGFVFWPRGLPEGDHTQAEVYFTIASVLQQLRANAGRGGKPGKSAIRTNWFQQTLLAPGNFGRFNDDVIQASILRAALPAELNYRDRPEDSREMGRLIARILKAAGVDRGGAAAEFLLALGTRRLQLRREDLDIVLKVEVGGIDLVRWLQGVCAETLSDV
ncbi:hypothetical protein D3C73_288540 [compost metagenome]